MFSQCMKSKTIYTDPFTYDHPSTTVQACIKLGCSLLSFLKSKGPQNRLSLKIINCTRVIKAIRISDLSKLREILYKKAQLIIFPDYAKDF